MSFSNLIPKRFAKFSKKGAYLKILIPEEARADLEGESPLNREALQKALIQAGVGSVHSFLTNVMNDPVERRRAISEHTPSLAMRG